MARRRVLLAALGWLAVAAAAVTVGVLAISLLGRGLTEGTSQPLSSDAVARALAKASADATPGPTSARPDPTTSPSDTGKPSPTPPGKGGKFDPAVTSIPSRGGTVLARCDGDQAYLTSWSPHPNFETEEAERGPDSTASVEFEGDDVKVKIVVRCVGGRPEAETEIRPD